MDFSLEQGLKLQQNLSPQMLQSLALLPMTSQELKAHIHDAIESNPALEIPESFSQEVPESQHEFEAQNVGGSSSSDDYGADSFGSDSFGADGYDPEASDRKESFLENTPADGESLSEHLLKQLGESDVDDVTDEIAELLIGNLDQNGFFIVPLETLFEGHSYTAEQKEKAVLLVQSFEPYGICVKDFRESLIVQARCSGMAKSDLEIFSNMVNTQLENITEGKLKEAARNLKINLEDLESFIAILKSFTPYPGRQYSSESQGFVSPEFSIHNVNGQLVLNINKANLPQLELSPEFEELSKQKNEKETAAYISDSIKQAKSLINQVQLRYQTLSKTAVALMELQKDFFFEGPRALKTLTLKDVAEKVGVHETTISRLAQNKYVETDWGIFQMKYFFTQGVSTSEGSSMSRTAVKDIIAEIKKANPKMSAQKISDELASRGINCARRTVAKYLAELNL